MIWIVFLFLSGALVVVDRVVKGWAVANLMPVGTMDFLGGFVKLTYVENRGAAFGFLQDARWVLVALPAVFIVAIIIYYARLPKQKIYWAARIPLALITAGAVGNLIDRALKGFVVDLFEFGFVTFPVFNVADICITTGAAAFAIVTLFVIKDAPAESNAS